MVAGSIGSQTAGCCPVYVSDLSEDLDVEVRARLEHLAGVTALSDRLVEALLIGKHVLVVVDGLSEMSKRALDAVKPHGGSKLSRAVVITTRVPPQLPDSHAVRPLLVGREDMGDMVDRFIAKKYGRGRFTEGQTEVIVSSLRRLFHASGGSDRLSRAVPMIFVELMLKQAHLRADDGAGLESLPTSSVGLFEQYTLDVLRSTANREQSVDDARIAAQVSLAPDYVPKLRSRKAFDEAGLSRKAVDELIASGLMTRVGTDVDPRFRFTLDPVAEYLAAKWEVIVARHDERAQAELSALLSRLEEQGGEARSEGFIAALKECLALEDAVDGESPSVAT